MTIDTQNFKNLLLNEQSVLEEQLASMGKKNSASTSDWDATTPEKAADEAEEGDIAENLEQFENNNAEVAQLEQQLKDVTDALEKIEQGTYGVCEIGGEEIETDRLEANPSARTCKAHMN